MELINRNSISNCLIYLAGIFILILQSSCTPYKQNERIIIAGAGKITSVDPAQANTFHALQLISALGDPLYRLSKGGELVPKLALQKPIIKNNGLSILIPLRKDVIFHDGTPFNAEAMAFSIKRFKRIGTMNYILDERIRTAEAIKPYLLEIQLNRPSVSIKRLLSSINLTPISPIGYSNHSEKFLNKKFIGTGPYILTNFTPHQQRLKPFKNYWGLQPQNAGVDYVSLSNSTALFAGLQSREIDLLLSGSLYEDQSKFLNKMAQEGKLLVTKGNALEIGFISFNTKSEPLNNIKFRKALSFTLDRDLISERVSYGSRKPLRSLIPASLKKDSYNPWPVYDPLRAMELMKESGYCNKKKAIISLTFRSNVPADKLLALTWQEQIKRDFNQCLEITLDGIESTTIYRQLKDGNFQAVILDWRGAYPDPEAYLNPLLSCKVIVNSVCEKGEAVTSGSFWASTLLNKLLKESDQVNSKERAKKLIEIEKIAAKENPYLPIWIVTPKAWGQTYLNKPEFDGNGQILIHKLTKGK